MSSLQHAAAMILLRGEFARIMVTIRAMVELFRPLHLTLKPEMPFFSAVLSFNHWITGWPIGWSNARGKL